MRDGELTDDARLWAVMVKVRRLLALAVAAGSAAAFLAAGQAVAGQAVQAQAASIVAGTQSGTSHACVDTPLTITFPSAPTLGTVGAITVFNPDGTVEDSINLANPADFTETVGGATDEAGNLHYFNYYPVIITGDTATIYLHHELSYGRRYAVSVDAGVFTGEPGITWRFTTTGHRVPAKAREITVDARGNGDFCTVQGAINAVSPGQPATIRVHQGVYTELDWVAPDKPNITVIGANRDKTIMQYANNNTLNAADTTDICARQAIPVHDDYNCWRSNFSDEANDFTLENITLRNTTPYGGSQAEAFRGNADRVTLYKVSLYSYQDTIRIQGLAYVADSFIAGDVDFTWGTGTVYWTHDTLESEHAGYVSQVRNPQGQFGYVFYKDTLTAAPGVADGSVYLARIDPTVYPYSQDVYIDSRMGPQINPAGWLLTAGTCATNGADLQFWEYGSTTLTGQPVDTSQRLSCSQQVTAAQAAQWANPAFVLGGWVPAVGQPR
jgi:pectin methylesterase-like acyl-CoA thioesterase